MIFRKSSATSIFGIAAADCPLADELIEGAYTVRCRVGDVESTAAVNVHHYVLPKIKLTVTTERAWYLPGEEVRGIVKATYIHGEPVADAEWTLDLPRSDQKSSGRTLIRQRTGPDGIGSG